MRTTFLGKVVAKRDGMYELIVFQNLDEHDNSLFRYITTTRLPNWEGQTPSFGDIGYVECEYVNAGDEYWNRSTQAVDSYNYTACYFIHFIPKQEDINIKEFNF